MGNNNKENPEKIPEENGIIEFAPKLELIYKAILDIQQEVPVILKGREAKIKDKPVYSFRGIDDVYNALHPLFRKNRVFMVPAVMTDKTVRETRKSSSGGSLNYVFLKVKYRLYAEDGSFVEAITEGEAMDSGDKATNKAMSVAQKYALLQIFQIPTEESKDPEDNDHETVPIELVEKYTQYQNELALLNSKEEIRAFWNKQPKEIKDNKLFENLFIKRAKEL